MPTTFRLREILEAKGISQSELSRLSGVSFATINRMCTNATESVALSTLDKLASALGVEPGELIARARPTRRKS
jgi:DNA-binding Xre family transcriptional regulator